MKLAFSCLLAVLLGVGNASAQDPPNSDPASSSQATSATVAGIVTKSPSSEPVKKALIELIAERQSQAGNYTALSGADGAFLIENVVAGTYRLFVERTGYQQTDNRHRRIDGRMLTLRAGQEIKDLVIHLQAAAVVEGRVTDEDGDPMSEAQVTVLRQTYAAGRTHWEQAGAERTNDLGEYRISGLSAGLYFISVTPPPNFRSLIETAGSAPHAATSAKNVFYQTVYYPGTRDRGQASAIQLHSGDDFPASFSLTPSPGFSIRGSVANLPAGFTASIMLQSNDFNLMLNGAEIHKDGSFEIRDVSPGAYTLIATVDNSSTPMSAHQALQVGSANVEGLRLTPQAGGTVSGHLQLENAASVGGKPDRSQLYLFLRPARDDDAAVSTDEENFSTLTRVKADGSFEWKDVPAGRYTLQIADVSAVPDWYLKSASSGGHDALLSGFTLAGGSAIVELLASTNGATIEGVVSTQKDESGKEEVLADAVVVAVPETRFLKQPDRYRKAESDQHGRFTLRGLPPGDYTLFAWESVDGEAYYNQEFLKAYEGQGKALRVNEGDRTTTQLKAIPTAGD